MNFTGMSVWHIAAIGTNKKKNIFNFKMEIFIWYMF